MTLPPLLGESDLGLLKRAGQSQQTQRSRDNQRCLPSAECVGPINTIVGVLRTPVQQTATADITTDLSHRAEVPDQD